MSISVNKLIKHTTAWRDAGMIPVTPRTHAELLAALFFYTCETHLIADVSTQANQVGEI